MEKVSTCIYDGSSCHGSQCPSELQSADRLPSAGREAL